MTFRPFPLLSLVWLVLLLALAGVRPALAVDPVPVRTAPDSLVLSAPAIAPGDGTQPDDALFRMLPGEEGGWRRAPYGDDLLTHPDPWRSHHPKGIAQFDLLLDYDRVDLLRPGAMLQLQRPETMRPRFGAMVASATGRRRTLYGLQLEQPLLPTARFVLGLDAERRTDHGDLQQIDDAENSLLLLVAHEDWRDYFEREGFGAYLSWRVPDFSTVSVHLRRDDWRSLHMADRVGSWWHTDRVLRGNPAIDDGESRSVIVRLERLARHTRRGRGGVYHWIEFENTGGALGGDFDYTRALADVRSIVRLSPITTLTLRGVGGAGLHGVLPTQRWFTLGGVDGLRAHAFGEYRGDRVLLGQLECSVGLRAFSGRALPDGPQVLAFLDSGTAWNHRTEGSLVEQRFAADGGVGVAVADDALRLTAAWNLQRPDDGVVVTLRLQRPF